MANVTNGFIFASRKVGVWIILISGTRETLRRINKKSLQRCKLFVFWWPGAELNRRHADFQSAALPTELPSHYSLLSLLITDFSSGITLALLALAFTAARLAAQAAGQSAALPTELPSHYSLLSLLITDFSSGITLALLALAFTAARLAAQAAGQSAALPTELPSHYSLLSLLITDFSSGITLALLALAFTAARLAAQAAGQSAALPTELPSQEVGLYSNRAK